jgi:hypothetical protein
MPLQFLHFDTSLRTDPTDDPFNCTLTLANPLRNIKKIYLKSCEIPLGFFNFRSANDLFFTMRRRDYEGDISFGKTAVIDHNVSKLGIFSEVVANRFLPKRNNAVLKYLVNKDGELTEAGAKDLEGVVQQFLYDGGDVALPELFESLSFLFN